MKEVHCNEVIERLYLWLDGELDAKYCADLEAHIERCAECLGRSGVERRFKEMIQEKCSQHEVPGSLVERIRQLLRSETT